MISMHDRCVKRRGRTRLERSPSCFPCVPTFGFLGPRGPLGLLRQHEHLGFSSCAFHVGIVHSSAKLGMYQLKRECLRCRPSCCSGMSFLERVEDDLQRRRETANNATQDGVADGSGCSFGFSYASNP